MEEEFETIEKGKIIKGVRSFLSLRRRDSQDNTNWNGGYPCLSESYIKSLLGSNAEYVELGINEKITEENLDKKTSSRKKFSIVRKRYIGADGQATNHTILVVKDERGKKIYDSWRFNNFRAYGNSCYDLDNMGNYKFVEFPSQSAEQGVCALFALGVYRTLSERDTHELNLERFRKIMHSMDERIKVVTIVNNKDLMSRRQDKTVNTSNQRY